LTFANFIVDTEKKINTILISYLPSITDKPIYLHQAMHYAVFNGGKRLRPLLAYATGEVIGVQSQLIDTIACALEFIHCYSLIHDDLPAMDNDDFRRGQPSCHKAFNEATALLAGNALLTLAIEILCTIKDDIASPVMKNNMQKALLMALASHGLVGGQALEFDPLHKINSLEDIEQIHGYKTAALIKAAVQLPLFTQESLSQKQKEYLLEFAENIGLAYQIKDDLFDWQHQDSHDLNKQSIPNYVALAGEQTASNRIQDLHQQATLAIRQSHLPTQRLEEMAEYMLSRKY
jgi:farnesyl diphosphate synthase